MESAPGSIPVPGNALAFTFCHRPGLAAGAFYRHWACLVRTENVLA